MLWPAVTSPQFRRLTSSHQRVFTQPGSIALLRARVRRSAARRRRPRMGHTAAAPRTADLRAARDLRHQRPLGANQREFAVWRPAAATAAQQLFETSAASPAMGRQHHFAEHGSCRWTRRLGGLTAHPKSWAQRQVADQSGPLAQRSLNGRYRRAPTFTRRMRTAAPSLKRVLGLSRRMSAGGRYRVYPRAAVS